MMFLCILIDQSRPREKYFILTDMNISLPFYKIIILNRTFLNLLLYLEVNNILHGPRLFQNATLLNMDCDSECLNFLLMRYRNMVYQNDHSHMGILRTSQHIHCL